MKHIINITTFYLLWTAISYGQLSFSPVTEPMSNKGCSDLAIKLTTPKGNNTFYAISYCNLGEAVAENSYLEIHLDSDLSIVQATAPLQYKAGGTYRFLIGDVLPSDCGSMYFQIPQSLIKSHCLNVFAATASPCTPEPMLSNIVRSSEDDGGTTTTTDPDGNSGDYALTQSETDLTRMTLGADVDSDPIFEDHVFLDFVPTWDSLIRMFSDLQSYNFTSNDSFTATSTIVIVPIEEELPEYATTSYCRYQAISASNSLTYITGEGDTPSSTWATNNNSNTTSNEVDILNTSTLSIEQEQSILLSPNPIQQQARLTVIGYGDGDLKVEVFSGLGQQVGLFESKSTEVLFQVNQWNKGIYFYRVYINNQFIKSERFVVQ